MKYFGTDCTPIGTYTNSEIFNLDWEWNNILKKSGFEDIELWGHHKSRGRSRQIKFTKGHVRWDNYKTKEKFLQIQEETANYFRVLSLFSHHAPDKLLPSKYRLILQTYAQTGSLHQALEDLGSTTPRTSVSYYIQRYFSRMVDFVITEFSDE